MNLYKLPLCGCAFATELNVTNIPQVKSFTLKLTLLVEMKVFFASIDANYIYTTQEVQLPQIIEKNYFLDYKNSKIFKCLIPTHDLKSLTYLKS